MKIQKQFRIKVKTVAGKKQKDFAVGGGFCWFMHCGLGGQEDFLWYVL